MWCSISFDCRTQSNSIHGLSSIEFDFRTFDLLCRDFWSARFSKRTNPPLITLLPQLLHRSKADILKFLEVYSLRNFIKMHSLRSICFESASLREIRNRRFQSALDTYAVRIVCRQEISNLTGVVSGQLSTSILVYLPVDNWLLPTPVRLYIYYHIHTT